MIHQATVTMCREIGHFEQSGMVWMLLGFACGRVDRALPDVQPPLSLLAEVARCVDRDDPFSAAAVAIDEWITVHDQMRRTRLRRAKDG
jgi:hypothetical protein